MAKRYIKRGEKSRAKVLLDMYYTPEEIEWETGIDVHRLHRVLPNVGMPFAKDAQGKMWIKGVDFAAWVQIYDKDKKVKLKDGEGYCVRCNRAVVMQRPRVKHKKGLSGLLLQGDCPNCGVVVSRGIGKVSAQ